MCRLSGRWPRKVAHARPALEKIPMDRKIGGVGNYFERTDAHAGVQRRGLGRPGNLLVGCASPRLPGFPCTRRTGPSVGREGQMLQDSTVSRTGDSGFYPGDHADRP